MYPFYNNFSVVLDPIETKRSASGRPATQMEILQRAQREERLRWLAIADQEARADARDRSPLHRLPQAISSIGRSIRRSLGNGGQRVNQQAA